MGFTEKEFQELSAELSALREKLAGSERFFALGEWQWRLAVESVGDGMWDLDLAEGRLIRSKELLAILGYAEGELDEIASSWEKNSFPGDVEKIKNRFSGYLTGEMNCHSIEYRIIRKDGAVRWVFDRGRVYSYDAGGRPRRIIGIVTDITDRKRTEEALRDSEEKYRSMMEAITDMVYICSADYRIEYMNPAMQKKYGGDRTGARCYEVLHGLAEVCPWCVNERVFKGESVVWEMKSPGDGRIYEISNSPVRHSDGFVSKMAVIKDVTDKHEALEALEAEKERLAVTLRSIGEAVIAVDTQYRITLMNGAAEEITGRGRGEAMGMVLCDAFKIHSNATGEEIDCPARQAILTGEVIGYGDDTVYYSPDGKKYFLSVNTSPILDSSGRTIGAILVFSDITGRRLAEDAVRAAEAEAKNSLERKVAERTEELRLINEKLMKEIAVRGIMQETLREREERYRTIFENTSDLIAEVDAAGRYLYLSPNYRDVLGYSVEEMSGRLFYEFIHPDDLARAEKEFRVVASERSEGDIVMRMRHRDGSYRWFESVGKFYRAASGNFHGVVISRDITERRRNEEEMMKASKLESLGTLAGGIAHDFNNILMGISGNLMLAGKCARTDERLREILARAEKIVHKARALTEQLITFSRGGLPIKKICDLNEIVLESAKFAVTGANVSCNFDLAPGLWQVEADEGQLVQVITNIALNAKQAMPEGGVIDVSTFNRAIAESTASGLPAGEYVGVSIKDRGVGISPGDLEKIFDPYFTTRATGSGLGLSTAYSIVRNHGGAITVESAPGIGSDFLVLLPATHRAVPAAADDGKAADKLSSSVLLMDDDDTVLLTVSEMLGDLGCEVSVARDGAEAIELYTKRRSAGRPFDVVIMDLIVPGGMGGREAMKRLLEMDPRTVAIVSSGYSNDEVMAEHRRFGFSGVLAKPYHQDELRRKIAGVTNNGAGTEDR